MGAVPATFPAAPLDRMARIVTAFVWGLAAVFVAAGVAMLGAEPGWPGAVMLVAGAAIAVTLVWMRRLEPRSYVMEDGSLSIRRRSASPRTFEGTPAGVRRGALGWRVAGDGGGYGYLGRFRAEGRTVQAYVTDRARVVLLEVGGAGLAISPADPDAFVGEVGRGA